MKEPVNEISDLEEEKKKRKVRAKRQFSDEWISNEENYLSLTSSSKKSPTVIQKTKILPVIKKNVAQQNNIISKKCFGLGNKMENNKVSTDVTYNFLHEILTELKNIKTEISTLKDDVSKMQKEQIGHQQMKKKILEYLQILTKDKKTTQIQRKTRERKTPEKTKMKDKFPISSLKHLNTVLNNIKDEKRRKEIDNYFRSIGGITAYLTLRDILRTCFTNEFAIQCSWTGRNKKIPLGKLTLINLIIDIIVEHPECPTRDKVKIWIMEWFKQSSKRAKRITNTNKNINKNQMYVYNEEAFENNIDEMILGLKEEI